MYLEELLRQIEAGAGDHRFYYLALMGALALPDICAGLAAPDGLTTAQRYQDWYAAYAANKFSFLSAEDCYRFRCSMLHQGRTMHPKGSFSRIIFIEPQATSNIFHMNILHDALNIDILWFCRDMVASARKWLTDVQDTEPFMTNYASFVRRYPNGFPPYIVGFPVIS